MSLFENNSEQNKPSVSLLDPLASQGGWQKGPFKIDQVTGRVGHASVIIDQYLIIIGGMHPEKNSETASLLVFDMQKETCALVEISGRQSYRLYNHSACYWKDNQIIIYGGENEKTILSEVGIITLSFTETTIKAEWKTVETDTKIQRLRHSAHIYKNQMIVLGGQTDNRTYFKCIYILNLDDFKWRRLDFKPPGEWFEIRKSALSGSRIYMLSPVPPNYTSRFASLDLESYDWKELPMEFDCSVDAAQEYNGKIYTVRRPKFKFRPVLNIFDLSQEKWSFEFQSNDKNLISEYGYSLNVYGNQLVLFVSGGNNDLWFFKLDDSAEIQKDSLKKQPKEGITQQMKSFLTEAPYSDVIFEVESESIPAHKWWLCNKSKYFANMFSSGMMEAKSSKIVISDMSATTFRGFLEYLYSDDVELNVALAKDLLTQADKYSVPALKELCEQFLLNNIEPDNYVILASLSDLLEANKLRDAVRDYIAKNIKVLRPRKDFEEISIDMLRDVLIKVTVR